MKQIFLLIALSCIGLIGYAQGGGITINNINNPCGVYVTLTAQEPLNGAPACSIESNKFYIAAGTVSPAPWATSVFAFEAAVGWIMHPAGAVMPGTTDFQWLSVAFQFDCPASVLGAGCSNAGGYMINIPPAITCVPPFPVTTTNWNSTSWGGCRTGLWNTAGSAPLFNDIITFW